MIRYLLMFVALVVVSEESYAQSLLARISGQSSCSGISVKQVASCAGNSYGCAGSLAVRRVVVRRVVPASCGGSSAVAVRSAPVRQVLSAVPIVRQIVPAPVPLGISYEQAYRQAASQANCVNGQCQLQVPMYRMEGGWYSTPYR